MTKSGFCVCVITFQTQSTHHVLRVGLRHDTSHVNFSTSDIWWEGLQLQQAQFQHPTSGQLSITKTEARNAATRLFFNFSVTVKDSGNRLCSPTQIYDVTMLFDTYIP